MVWDLISPSNAISHAISHGITPKEQENSPSTKTDHLVAVCLWLWLIFSVLFFQCVQPDLFCRTSVAHQMDTSYNPYHQHTPTLSPHDSACHLTARLFCSFFFLFLLFSPLFPSPIFIVWYRYRDIAKCSRN